MSPLVWGTHKKMTESDEHELNRCNGPEDLDDSFSSIHQPKPLRAGISKPVILGGGNGMVFMYDGPSIANFSKSNG